MEVLEGLTENRRVEMIKQLREEKLRSEDLDLQNKKANEVASRSMLKFFLLLELFCLLFEFGVFC